MDRIGGRAGWLMNTKLHVEPLQENPDPLAPQSLSTLPILLLHVHEHCNCRCLICDIWPKTDGNFARHRDSLLKLEVREVVARNFRASIKIEANSTCGKCVCSLNYKPDHTGASSSYSAQNRVP